MIKIDHLGIAVESIASARPLYEALGLHVSQLETVQQEQVRIAMISLGDSRIELLEPLQEESPVGRFLRKRGAGLHHVALHVDDIAATLASLRAQGVRVVSEHVQVGASGHLYFFVHPSNAGGVLLEICQNQVPHTDEGSRE